MWPTVNEVKLSNLLSTLQESIQKLSEVGTVNNSIICKLFKHHHITWRNTEDALFLKMLRSRERVAIGRSTDVFSS